MTAKTGVTDVTTIKVLATWKIHTMYVRKDSGSDSSRVYTSYHFRSQRVRYRHSTWPRITGEDTDVPLLNRFMMRPLGVVSKKDMGAMSVDSSNPLNNCFRERKTRRDRYVLGRSRALSLRTQGRVYCSRFAYLFGGPKT